MFRPICYRIIFVVLSVWHNMQNISEELWKHFLSSSELFWVSLSSFYLYALWAITFISVTLFFGQSLRVNILNSGSDLPMPSFIDDVVLEQRLQKIMVRKDLMFLHFFPFYCYMPRLKKNHLFLYFFCNFDFFVSVFKYIVTRRYIVKNILSFL